MRCEWWAAVILGEVALELRARHEAELAARALMNVHDPVLDVWNLECHQTFVM